jgi:purine-binding chemotaxis protein CheW
MFATRLRFASRWLVFSLDAQRYALPLESIQRVVRAAAITPLPQAPEFVAGVIDVAGRVLPVFDLRRRLDLPPRALALNDQFILARTPRREVALVVDATSGLIEAEPVRDSEYEVLTHPEGLVLIHDLENFLTSEGDAALEWALRAAEARCTPTR